MEDKYYTPTHDDFAIGLKYEVEVSENVWAPVAMLPEYLPMNYDRWINMLDTIRVKYLDKEDIESLGWKHIENNKYMLDISIGFNTGTIVTLYMTGITLNISFELYGSWGSGDLNKVVFKIKNKSELTKLMKQLNIYEKN